eukprot:g4161.t1
MDKNIRKSRQQRMNSRRIGLWDSITSERTNSETPDNTSPMDDKSVNLLREHLQPLLQKILAEKEENIDSIICKSSIRLPPNQEKEPVSLNDELEQNVSSANSSLATTTVDSRQLMRSNSSFQERQTILAGIKPVVVTSRGLTNRSGIGKQAKRVESETNESLPLPEVDRPPRPVRPMGPRRLHVDVTTQSGSSSKYGSTHKEGPTLQDHMNSDLRLPLIFWTELKMEKELGAGQFATVKLANWNGVRVAVKEWNSLNDEENTDMAIQEAKTLSFLLHPCVLSFYGIVADGPSPGLVVEYLMHCSLKSQLEKMKGEETETKKFKIAVALQAALGMDFLHYRKVIHFDLKCENLLCDLRDLDNPIVKVGDVGLSKQKVMTFVSGNMRGTLPWMAPELFPPMQDANISSQAITDLVNEKVDVYSFGVVLWEIWEMGAIPYPELTSYELIEGIVEGKLKLQSPEHCDPNWGALMNKCLSRDPNERPDFGSIVKDLRKLQEEAIAQGVH